MKKFFIFIVVNIVLIATIFIVIDVEKKQAPQVKYLANVTGSDLALVKSQLSPFYLDIMYVESDAIKDQVIGTNPGPNSLVYYGQTIEVFVSTGNQRKKLLTMENQAFETYEKYLLDLRTNYQIKVLIEYCQDDYLPDGLIDKVESDSEYLEEIKELKLIVIDNPKTILLADFTGWYYEDVLHYAQENNIIIHFEYIDSFEQEDYVLAQSVLPNTPLIKGKGQVFVYLARNEW